MKESQITWIHEIKVNGISNKIPKIQNLVHCLVHDRPLSLDRPYILNHTKDLWRNLSNKELIYFSWL